MISLPLATVGPCSQDDDGVDLTDRAQLAATVDLGKTKCEAIYRATTDGYDLPDDLLDRVMAAFGFEPNGTLRGTHE